MQMLPLSNETIAIIGFLLGPIGRTLYDYMFKLLENPDLVFDKAYWITMIASMVIGFFTALVQCVIIIAQIPSGSQWFIFLSCFAQGFMLSHLINKPIDYVRRTR